MKYIDADKLKEKIEKKYLDAKEKARFAGETGTPTDCTKWDAIVLQYENVLRIIASFQQEQPEADLEKEIDEKWDELLSSEGERYDFAIIARHFYELGLNARKEESK